MISIVTVFLIGLTSLTALLFGARRLNLPALHLRAAGLRVLEGVGLAVIFFGANLAVWIAAILATRALTGWFVSVYLFNDLSVGVLSLLEGLMFQWWWRGRCSR